MKCYLVDLEINGNCYEGTEDECKRELENLVENYHHNKDRYCIRFNRFD